MNEPLSAMDVYSSRMSLPFDLAAYCRLHKHSVEAVNYARAIRAATIAADGLLASQRLSDEAEKRLEDAMQAVRDKMERDTRKA